MRTCDCPIVFEEDPHLVGQVHRYDCPLAPPRPPTIKAEVSLETIARIERILKGGNWRYD